ncbi:MAG: hypothetical protein RL701_1413 [Pseudomonadota bacterium]
MSVAIGDCKMTHVIHNSATFLMKYALFALLLSVGLRTTPRALRAAWSERRLVLRALAVVELGVPLLAILVLSLLPLPLPARTGLALAAVCPGSPLALRAERDHASIVVTVALSSLLVPVTLPFWTSLLGPLTASTLTVDMPVLLDLVLTRFLLPFGLGLAINTWLPSAAHTLQRIAWAVFVAGIVLGVVFALVRGAPTLLHVDHWTILALVLMVVGSAAMGHWAGKSEPNSGRALASVAVLGNPALLIAVVANGEPVQHALAIVAAYIVARAATWALFEVMLRSYRRAHPLAT